MLELIDQLIGAGLTFDEAAEIAGKQKTKIMERKRKHPVFFKEGGPKWLNAIHGTKYSLIPTGKPVGLR